MRLKCSRSNIPHPCSYCICPKCRPFHSTMSPIRITAKLWETCTHWHVLMKSKVSIWIRYVPMKFKVSTVWILDGPYSSYGSIRRKVHQWHQNNLDMPKVKVLTCLPYTPRTHILKRFIPQFCQLCQRCVEWPHILDQRYSYSFLILPPRPKVLSLSLYSEPCLSYRPLRRKVHWMTLKWVWHVEGEELHCLLHTSQVPKCSFLSLHGVPYSRKLRFLNFKLMSSA